MRSCCHNNFHASFRQTNSVVLSGVTLFVVIFTFHQPLLLDIIVFFALFFLAVPTPTVTSAHHSIVRTYCRTFTRFDIDKA